MFSFRLNCFPDWISSVRGDPIDIYLRCGGQKPIQEYITWGRGGLRVGGIYQQSKMSGCVAEPNGEKAKEIRKKNFEPGGQRCEGIGRKNSPASTALARPGNLTGRAGGAIGSSLSARPIPPPAMPMPNRSNFIDKPLESVGRQKTSLVGAGLDGPEAAEEKLAFGAKDAWSFLGPSGQASNGTSIGSTPKSLPSSSPPASSTSALLTRLGWGQESRGIVLFARFRQKVGGRAGAARPRPSVQGAKQGLKI